MAATAMTFAFPHPVLTPVVSRPTNTSLQLLQKELYANARATYTPLGGGANGYLGLIMPQAQYLARTGGIAFIAPVHPGPAPVHAAGATQHQITETNRQYLQDVHDHRQHMVMKETLKQQLIAAVQHVYIQVLEDPDFGFADVSAEAMLTHLKTTYGTISREEIDANRVSLTQPWNPDEPIENLWVRIPEAQRIANLAVPPEPITDSAALRALLTVFEATGVFITACEKWRDKVDAEWTLANFREHFTRANKERMRQLTAGKIFHGANAATGSVTSPAASDLTTPTGDESANASRKTGTTATTPGTTTSHTVETGSATMYYCWSHGLGKNSKHTSVTCSKKKDGHKDEATAIDMMGGNDRIMGPRPRRLPFNKDT